LAAGDVPVERVKALAKRRAKKGKRTPMWDNAPLLQRELVPVMNGWEEVQLTRHWRHDGEPYPVAATEIEGYLNGMRVFDPWLRSYYIRMIRATDLIWMDVRKKHGNTHSSNSS
jgi:hypothetical protein